MHEPSTYLNGLSIKDLEDLLADIKGHTELQQHNFGPKSRAYMEQYWQDMTTITEDKLAEFKKLSSPSSRNIDDEPEDINRAVVEDVIKTFENKTLEQEIKYFFKIQIVK
jgi:hypothetical protein